MKTLTYTGERGQTITLGAYTFEVDKPQNIDDDAAADQMLGKGLFKESPAPVHPEDPEAPAKAPAEEQPAPQGSNRRDKSAKAVQTTTEQEV